MSPRPAPHRASRSPRPASDGPSPIVVLLGVLVSAALIAGEVYLIRRFFPALDRKGWLIVAGATLAYVLAGHFIRIHADTSDLGLLGGLVDNPFSFSDDVNRFLVFLQVLLMPGRLIAESVLAAGRWIFH